ncbi:PHP domain-containing protein [Pseudomonas sp. N040]|uniref:PHP domain-containing protein n=1 Tax=Pseudomonas sp. N040 TaxID=2785325 RepID=UPI0018A2B031|nr:PHP domain-containing protein [Pseudomonas sp. N040]MBF7729510.1 PHP domain-containing protein [Pseudomonas sp. N040]MBW7013150.1 PHP domain-containing protein [Pseudomonas sp. N040]
MHIDLHCHSTASDGALAPAAVVARAHARGVRVLALTDHDTLEGLGEARQAAAALPDMQLVSGIELSCTWGGATIHVLGYGFSAESPELLRAIEDLHHGRWARAEEIGRRLEAKGMPGAFVGARDVQMELGDSANAPARPHFAEFLVRAGHVADRGEAFRKWLGAGKIGDVKQHWPTLEQAVGTLRAAGAWISLAHPIQYDFTRSKRRKLLADFIRAGGHGLEVVNGLQPAEQTGTLAILAREFGLLVSAGSDFHAPTDWSELGMYRPIPEDLPLLAARLKLAANAAEHAGAPDVAVH